MKLKEIVESVGVTVVYGAPDWEDLNIEAVFASDLMSDVLMSDLDDFLLITSLSTEQSVRSVGIVGSEVILIANKKAVTDGMIELAKDQEITILSTSLPKYESCLRLGKALEQ